MRKDMQEIYREDFQLEDTGRHTRTIFDEPRMVTFRFDSAAMLRDTMAYYSLD